MINWACRSGWLDKKLIQKPVNTSVRKMDRVKKCENIRKKSK